MRLAYLFLLSLPLAATDDPVTEITLERSRCFGTCPVDKVTFRSDGTALYKGTDHVARLGEYRGRVGAEDFRKLARLLDEKKFFELDARYAVPATDLPTLTTTAKRGDRSKKVEHYGKNAGPEGLREIEKQIIELIDKVEWQKEG